MDSSYKNTEIPVLSNGEPHMKGNTEIKAGFMNKEYFHYN